MGCPNLSQPNPFVFTTPMAADSESVPTPAAADRTLAAEAARAVQAVYAALPKTGKPQPHEHTVLAGNGQQATIHTSRAFSVRQHTPPLCFPRARCRHRRLLCCSQ